MSVMFILSLSTQNMNNTIYSICWHVRDTFCLQECQVLLLYKCLHQCLWYRCVVWSGNFRMVFSLTSVFTFHPCCSHWYSFLVTLCSESSDCALTGFAEVLCFEFGMCSPQVFVNCDLSLYLLTFCATLNLITAVTLAGKVWS